MSAFDQSGHRQSSWVDSRLHRVLRFNFVAARIPTFDLDQIQDHHAESIIKDGLAFWKRDVQ